jgi:hypothetical protein
MEAWRPPGQTISEDDLLIVESLVKKSCRGALSVASRCPSGHPEVIRYYPLSRDPAGGAVAPFPTLFWLVCPAVIRQVSFLEARGGVDEMETRLSEDPELLDAYRRNHEAYRDERWSLLAEADQRLIEERGWDDVYHQRGIGGILDWRFVKCLHLQYAHHRAQENVVGALVEELAQIRGCV